MCSMDFLLKALRLFPKEMNEERIKCFWIQARQVRSLMLIWFDMPGHNLEMYCLIPSRLSKIKATSGHWRLEVALSRGCAGLLYYI
jgi:hypothetical protein